MDQILSYVKPELLVVVVFLYFIGAMIKNQRVFLTNLFR